MKIKWYLVVIFLIAAWWFFMRKKKHVRESGAMNSPLNNLQKNIKLSEGAADLVTEMIDKLQSSLETKDMVDDQPITQNSVRPGEFICAVHPMIEKITGERTGTNGEKLRPKMKRDHMWWPEDMYFTIPEWNKDLPLISKPCNCGCGETYFYAQ